MTEASHRTDILEYFYQLELDFEPSGNSLKWFKHDCNFSDSPQGFQIQRVFGIQGERNYWRLQELLAKSDFVSLEMTEDNIAFLAFKFNWPEDETARFINTLVKNGCLFVDSNNRLSSDNLIDDYKTYLSLASRGAKGGKAKRANSETQKPQTGNKAKTETENRQLDENSSPATSQATSQATSPATSQATSQATSNTYIEDIQEKTRENIEKKQTGGEIGSRCRAIVEHLNQKAGTSFSPTEPKTVNLISQKLLQGFKDSDIKTVIDKKTAEWLETEFAQYLRPSTLFGDKFEQYLNQAPSKPRANKGSTGYQQRQYSESELESHIKYALFEDSPAESPVMLEMPEG